MRIRHTKRNGDYARITPLFAFRKIYKRRRLSTLAPCARFWATDYQPIIISKRV